MAFIVPPGGFSGFAQMTPASRARLSQTGTRTSPGRRRRRKGSKAKARTRARSSSRKSTKRKPKFGSPAWRKMYMKKK